MNNSDIADVLDIEDADNSKPIKASRREVLALMSSIPFAAILADPVLAKKRASLLQTVSLSTKQLGKTVTASLALPEELTEKTATILLVHEWYGLNDQIRSVAAEFAKQGYIALAVDLYDRQIGFTREECGALMNAVKPEEAQDTIVSWVDWLKDHEYSNGKVGIVGWCFGGGWSLKASLATEVDATVVYYGDVSQKAEQLSSLKGPVLGHFATKDGWISPKMVAGFEEQMKAAGKPLSAHSYEADHAFANPTKASYTDDNAKLAWQRTLDFYKANL